MKSRKKRREEEQKQAALSKETSQIVPTSTSLDKEDCPDSADKIVPPNKKPRVESSQKYALPHEDKPTQSSKETKKGVLSAAEREAVDKAIQEFLDEHEIPREELQFILHPKLNKSFTNRYQNQKTFNNFARQIRDRAMVDRTPKQVYWYLRRAYNELREKNPDGTVQKRKWTKEEDEELLGLIQLKGMNSINNSRNWKLG